MSLQDLQTNLQQLAAQGKLNFGSLAEQVPAMTAVFDELPADSSIALDSPNFALTGSGADQLLTVKATVNWGLLQGLSATFTVALDPSLANGYIATAQIKLPDSTQLGIPAVSWFALGQFFLGGSSLPFSLYSTGLQPTALVNLGATLLINSSASQTPIPISIASGSTGILQLTLNTAAVEMPSINDILAAFGDSSGINLPSTINSLLNFSLLDLSVAFDPSAGSVAQIGVEIGNSAQASGKWDIIPGYIALDSYKIGLTIFDPFKTRQIGGLIATTITIGSVNVSVAASHPPAGGWELAGSTQEGDVISIGEFITYLTQKFGIAAPPAWLQSITLKNIAVTFDTATKDFTFTVTADAEISDKPCELVINFALTYPDGSYTLVLDGTLTVGTQTFALDFEKTGTDTQMGVRWIESPGNNLSLQDIAGIFGNESLTSILGEIPSNMDLALTSLSFTYDFTNHELVLTAVSTNYGALVFVATRPVDTWVFVFLAAVGTIDLTQLPLIGEEVGALGKFEIDNFNLLVCSGIIAQGEIKKINLLIAAVVAKTKSPLPTLPDTTAGLQQGVNLNMLFLVAGFSAPVVVGTATPKTGGSQTLALLGAGNAEGRVASALMLADPANPQTQNGYWIDLQKAFGPVYMDKIGFNYAGGAIEVLFNFSLKLGALTITLDGLMVGSTLTKFDPIFGLQGLSLTFNSGVVEISGGFIRQVIDGVTEYNGQALIKAGTFALAAMGSYAKVNGETSMFIFALLEAPLGGPAFFFVTGLAAGFGYNRGLVIPTIDQIATFPLVSGFVPGQSSPFSGSDPGAALQVLASKNIVPIQIGEDWLAAGIQFTSFEMLQSFALVVVEFGASLEIALLGLTTASVPTGDPRPLLFAQLAIEVRILPDEGLFAVDAKLTSSSYLLDQSCHLTGGFAFYLWFGSNTHAGDFVITLGGYHPNFNKPDYYPDVPRLGFNWVVTSELTIKGGMYFALTPVCLMAGGSLQALWQSGNLKAWFDLGADFLIAWKPYHYEIAVYLSFGVSYTFNINLLFVTITKTISVSLGADLSIWGPAFSGVAHIHLWIISFTVRFGASSSQTPPPIPWSEFEQSFLPAATNASQQQKRLARRLMKSMKSDAALADAPATQYQVWTVSVAKGLVRDVPSGSDNPDDIDWIVNPDGAVLQVKTLLPAKKYTLVVQGTDNNDKPVPVPASQIVITNQADLDGINVAFGVGPSDVASDDFTSGITVTLTYEDSTISPEQIFYFTALIQTAPKALWLPGAPDITNKETLVSNVLLGFEITTGQKQPDETPWADVSLLGFVNYDYKPALKWTAPDEVDGPPQPADPFGQLEKTILAAPGRSGILASLVAGGTPIDPHVDVHSMAARAGDFLLAPPLFAFEYALPSEGAA